MKDAWDKLSIASIALKDNKWLVLLFISMLGSTGTGIYQYFDKIDLVSKKEKEKNQVVQEVAIGFQKVITEVAKPQPSKPNSCSKCEQKLQDHLKEYRKNLREFHGIK